MSHTKQSTAVFLQLGSAKGCQGIRETGMRVGGRVLLAVVNFYVRIKIRVATFDIDHSVTDYTQTIYRCFKPEASSYCSQVGQLSFP